MYYCRKQSAHSAKKGLAWLAWLSTYEGSFMTCSRHLPLVSLMSSGLLVAMGFPWIHLARGVVITTRPHPAALLPSTSFFNGRLGSRGARRQIHQWRSTHRHSVCNDSALRAQSQGNACVRVTYMLFGTRSASIVGVRSTVIDLVGY